MLQCLSWFLEAIGSVRLMFWIVVHVGFCLFDLVCLFVLKRQVDDL